jgi:hypothetical protein
LPASLLFAQVLLKRPDNHFLQRLPIVNSAMFGGVE